MGLNRTKILSTVLVGQANQPLLLWIVAFIPQEGVWALEPGSPSVHQGTTAIMGFKWSVEGRCSIALKAPALQLLWMMGITQLGALLILPIPPSFNALLEIIVLMASSLIAQLGSTDRLLVSPTPPALATAWLGITVLRGPLLKLKMIVGLAVIQQVTTVLLEPPQG